MTSAAALKADLSAIAKPEDLESVRRFYAGGDPATRILGVSIGKIFPIAKRYTGLPLAEVETLLDDPHYEVRMAGVSVLDFKAREKRITDDERKALFDLYLRRHDRIDNWDLVDRAAPWVVGEYLLGRDRSVLDELARANSPHKRRTAIVATWAFIRRGETADTFRIADALAADPDTYVQKAIASWVREAGKRDPAALAAFLQRHRGVLPKNTVTAASRR